VVHGLRLTTAQVRRPERAEQHADGLPGVSTVRTNFAIRTIKEPGALPVGP